MIAAPAPAGAVNKLGSMDTQKEIKATIGITVNANEDIGAQLMTYRKSLKRSRQQVANEIGCGRANIDFFEGVRRKQSSPKTKGQLVFLVKYVRALGLSEITIKV